MSGVSTRFDRIDALRTVAMLWMTVFHFCFDLNHFGLIDRQNFYADPFWTWQRTGIVSLFLFTAGLSQSVALTQQGLQSVPAWQRLDRRFWGRWGQVAACAVLVSVGSAFMFPNSFIYFGVLHGLAVMLIIARLSAGWRAGLWWLGGGALLLFYIAPFIISTSDGWLFFNEKYANWLGFVSRKPVTEDYVPLLPWLAAVWWGMAAGQWMQSHRPHWLTGAPGGVSPATPSAARASVPPARRVDACVRFIAWPGRWSLSYYMLHQPVLIGVLMAWVAWSGGQHV
jgi:uncharacterized membrane protein